MPINRIPRSSDFGAPSFPEIPAPLPAAYVALPVQVFAWAPFIQQAVQQYALLASILSTAPPGASVQAN